MRCKSTACAIFQCQLLRSACGKPSNELRIRRPFRSVVWCPLAAFTRPSFRSRYQGAVLNLEIQVRGPLLVLSCWLGMVIAVQSPLSQTRDAHDFPTRPVRIIVSAPAGGGVDIITRLVAERLHQMLGQPFVVENRAGASGNAGAEAVATAVPDGYTLLATQPGPLTTNAALYKRVNYAPAAFEPLAIMTTIPNTLTVRGSLPVNTVQEFIAYARAQPGKLNYSSPGIGSIPHLTAELFAHRTGTKLVHVPHRGTAPAVTDLVAGHLDV